VDRPRSSGFQDQTSVGLVVLPFGPLAPVVRTGVPRAAAVFPWPVPDPGICFAVGLGHRPCSLRIRLEGLAGGSCLYGGLLIHSETSFSTTYSSGQGDPSGEVPLSGEVFPATRLDALEDDDGDRA
jgi:hypothetical protein